MKKLILKAIAKSADKAIQEVAGKKSLFYFYEPEMPTSLKDRKLKKK